MSGIPSEWAFVEKHYPGAYMAWLLDVNLPTNANQFRLGLSGRTAIASDMRCLIPDPEKRHRCECRVLIDGKWMLRSEAAKTGRWPVRSVSPKK